MKLVLWHTDTYPTAPGVYLDCFPRMGHDITWVVSERGARNDVVESRHDGVRHFTIRLWQATTLPRALAIPVNRWNKLLVFFMKARLMRRLARERPDVVQVRDMVTEGLLALWFARRSGVRFAYQLDHPHFEGRLLGLDLGLPGRPLERLAMRTWIQLRRVVLRGADLVFPISRAMAELLREREGVDPARMVVFPVGISRAMFERAVAADAPPGHPEARPTVCYLGNLDARRDPALVFGVLAEVARRVPESRALVVGEPSDLVRGLVRDFPFPDRLTFVPSVPYDQVPALLRSATVGIYPLAVDEPYGVNRTCSPLKVVEYMASGLPVVASRVTDAEIALEQSGGGVCVECAPAAFADAVERYLREPGRARAEGARGRAWVEAHRLFDVLARDVEAAYRRLLASDAAASRGGAASPPEHFGWLDIAKGLGILVVVFQHVLTGLGSSGIIGPGRAYTVTHDWTYAFVMPFFFFCSGLLAARSASRPWGRFVVEKLQTLVYPYAVWATLHVLLMVAFSHYTNHASSLRALLWMPFVPVDQYWFLHTLFVIAVLYATTVKLGARARGFLVLAAGLYATWFMFPLASASALHLVRRHAIYFALGAVMGAPVVATLLAVRRTTHLALVAVLGHAGLVLAVASGLEKSPAGWPLWALCGTAASLALAGILERVPGFGFVRVWGRHSLEIYVAHVAMTAATRIALHRLLGIDAPAVHLVAGTLAGLAGPLALVWCLRRIGFEYAFTLRPRGRAPGH